MLRYSLAFLVVAIIAGVFGFGAVEGTAMDIARVLFFVFLVLFVISLLFNTKAPAGRVNCNRRPQPARPGHTASAGPVRFRSSGEWPVASG